MVSVLGGYGMSLLLGGLLAMGMLAVQMKRTGLKAPLLCGVFSMVLGAAGARGYFILTQNLLGGYPMYGGIVSFYPYEHAMCGAVIGVCAGCGLYAALLKQKAAAVLDAMAPAGLIMIVAARLGEFFSDFGWGTVVSSSTWQRVPFAVMDMYEQWHWAVFVLEAALAAAVLTAVLCSRQGEPGTRFTLALLWWSLGQIFCESFRSETLRWGFVRVQQLQCAVFVLALLLLWSRVRGIKRPALARQLAVFAAGVGVVVFAEFALDKLNDIPNAALYVLMAAALTFMGCAVQKIVLDKKR